MASIKDLTGKKTAHPLNPNADDGLPCNYRLTIEVSTNDDEAYTHYTMHNVRVIGNIPTIEIDCFIEDRPSEVGRVTLVSVDVLNSEIMTDVDGDSYVNHDDIELNTEIIAYCNKGGDRGKSRGFILKDSNK